MLEWMKKRGSAIHKDATTDAGAPNRHRHRNAGQYRSLYEYLEKRYANTVVLTFRQVEDLLGFSLPDLARTDQAWWTTADISVAEASCSDAWILASRTARPNLMAQTVTFERVT